MPTRVRTKKGSNEICNKFLLLVPTVETAAEDYYLVDDDLTLLNEDPDTLPEFGNPVDLVNPDGSWKITLTYT